MIYQTSGQYDSRMSCWNVELSFKCRERSHFLHSSIINNNYYYYYSNYRQILDIVQWFCSLKWWCLCYAAASDASAKPNLMRSRFIHVVYYLYSVDFAPLLFNTSYVLLCYQWFIHEFHVTSISVCTRSLWFYQNRSIVLCIMVK